jgi:hypothetical protein
MLCKKNMLEFNYSDYIKYLFIIESQKDKKVNKQTTRSYLVL